MVSVGFVSLLAGSRVLQVNSSEDKLKPACLRFLVTFPLHPVDNKAAIPITPITAILCLFYSFKLLSFFIFIAGTNLQVLLMSSPYNSSVLSSFLLMAKAFVVPYF